MLAQLVADFQRDDPDHTFRLDIGRLRRNYSECIDLTVYRCVQEALTNAVRHDEVLLIDDHPVIMQGCRRILEDAGACGVIEATSDAAGYRLFRQHQPEVVIVDLSLQGKGLGGLGLSGLDLIRRLRIDNSRGPILVLSMHSDPVIVSRAIEAGATGYVSKEGPPENLIEAFEKVRRGETYLSHDLAVEVALLGTRGGATRFAELTPRQLQTLALVAEGKSYEQIAQDLGVSYKTVVNTCSQLKEKLGARKLSDLIRMAIEYLS